MMISNATLDKSLYIYMTIVVVVFSLAAMGSLYFTPQAYGSAGGLALVVSFLHIAFGILYLLV